MKRLLLLRHGKSDWEASVGHDRERPLKRRGERQAALMGRFLSATGHAPDRVVASTAVRALRSAEIAAAAGSWSCSVEPAESLYDASPRAALMLLRESEEVAATVLLCGHEPTMSELVLELSDGRVSFPTAAIARLDLPPRPWREQELVGGRLAWLVTPKLLSRAGLLSPEEDGVAARGQGDG